MLKCSSEGKLLTPCVDESELIIKHWQKYIIYAPFDETFLPAVSIDLAINQEDVCIGNMVPGKCLIELKGSDVNQFVKSHKGYFDFFIGYQSEEMRYAEFNCYIYKPQTATE